MCFIPCSKDFVMDGNVIENYRQATNFPKM